ncbi:alpha/beta fold hydrolase [Chromobacterium sp. IIBBL 290-4]|uniref:alpha/beta fold hydrolase n=1 Tax=Chromobacterium sp. IIBBL 290-4 TaxID=2953890 RepID=UPI0020B7974D|nr:alpha/beta fold hydrolase [Chromobacterium sp. IIBBL 290-4]UTH76039.1 esterase FrsA [Chromobacterium sp. IIBBL 290-4]
MFTFPLDSRELFAERRRQFAGWGIPRVCMDRVESRVVDVWRDGEGGWSREWAREAEQAVERRRWLLAAHLYGAACFPVANTPLRREAQRLQVACFLRASAWFPCRFERLELPGLGAAHLYQPHGEGAWPLVCLSGGVDTGKIALHRLALALARIGRFRVLAVDMPGTGESSLPLRADSEGYYRAWLARFAQGGPRALLGISFGGHWAAKLALGGEVDAAVNLGGPLIGAAELDADYAAALPNGMSGIVAHALGLAAMPSAEEALALLQLFSLRRQGLLDGCDAAPLLAVNGEADPYVPAAETEVFRAWPQAEVWRFSGLGHCAAEALPRILPALIAWLRMRLHGDTPLNRLAWRASRALLPRLA